MSKVGILLGSNLLNKLAFIKSAEMFLFWNVGSIVKRSSRYESPSWGYESTNTYLNQLLVLETTYSPEEVLERNLLIERILGRVRSNEGKYIDRTIDIDILFYDNLILETSDLQLPHPRLHLRRFCLVPIKEVVPDWQHPVFKKSIDELIQDCEDSTELTRYAAL